jgi:hypothetical protein
MRVQLKSKTEGQTHDTLCASCVYRRCMVRVGPEPHTLPNEYPRQHRAKTTPTLKTASACRSLVLSNPCALESTRASASHGMITPRYRRRGLFHRQTLLCIYIVYTRQNALYSRYVWVSILSIPGALGRTMIVCQRERMML